jgi:hypothetical protein
MKRKTHLIRNKFWYLIYDVLSHFFKGNALFTSKKLKYGTLIISSLSDLTSAENKTESAATQQTDNSKDQPSCYDMAVKSDSNLKNSAPESAATETNN